MSLENECNREYHPVGMSCWSLCGSQGNTTQQKMNSDQVCSPFFLQKYLRTRS